MLHKSDKEMHILLEFFPLELSLASHDKLRLSESDIK